MTRFRKKGRLFKAELTIWLAEDVCVHRTPDVPKLDGKTDSMAVWEALVVDNGYEGHVLDWEEEELHITPKEQG